MSENPAFRPASEFRESPGGAPRSPSKRSGANSGDDVIVVAPRGGGSSGKFLPPLFLVLLGTLFLAYRSASHDWRGLSAFFDTWTTRPRSAIVAPPALARAETPADESKPAPEPAPAPADELELAQAPDDADTPPPPAPGEAQPADAEPPAAGPDEIAREAEATRQRIAELEKLKEREAKKLAETAEERRNADRREQMGRRVDPRQLERMIAMQRQILERQLAWMDQFQREQMNDMLDMQRRFLRGGPGGNGFARGFAMPRNIPWPPEPGGQGPRQPGNVKERVIRTPDGGVARIREFQGPGMQGFMMRWGGEGAEPPPLPEPRRVRPQRGAQVPPPPAPGRID